MSIEQHCRREVAELHEFLQQWFRGELPATEGALARFEQVMAPEFEIISPAGNILARAAILSAVRERHGAEPGFPIEIRNHRHRMERGDVVLVTYEEWQAGKGRVSTALLRKRDGTPHGVEWVHVHETWMG